MAKLAVIFIIFAITITYLNHYFSTTWWQPHPGISWNIQLSNPPIDTEAPVELFDLDLYDTPKELIDELHSRGKKAVCYINMGAWEDWREDKNNYPASVIGKVYQGWSGESWLDIRAINILSPILQKRMDLCKAKGFDGIDADNLNSYQNDTGFALTPGDQLKFNKFLSDEAHKRGLAIGLKNDSEQASELADSFDWAITEGCATEGWCYSMKPFLDQDKPILQIEYTDSKIDFQKLCGKYLRDGFTPILKNRNLDGAYFPCLFE